MNLKKKAKKLEDQHKAGDKGLDNFSGNEQFSDNDKGSYFKMKQGDPIASRLNEGKAQHQYEKMKESSPLAARLNELKAKVGDKSNSDYNELKVDDPVSSSHKRRFQKLKDKLRSKK